MLTQLKQYPLARAVKNFIVNNAQNNHAAPPLNPQLKEALRHINVLREQGKYAFALDALQRLSQEYSNVSHIYLTLATVYFDLRMQHKAFQALSQAIECNPQDPTAALQLAKHLRKRAKTPSRDSIADVMLFVKDLGFQPATIIDVGVNTGTPGLFDFFPNAKLLMVDPLEESAIFMQHIAKLYPDAHYEVCAAAGQEGELTMCVYPSFGGSTVVEVAGRLSGGVDRKVPAHRLDILTKKYNCQGPYVLKIDTEGAELDVLAGATDILAETELLILETRLRPRGITPDLLKLSNQLQQYGFMPYDLLDRNYDRVDGTLKQIDMVAVRTEGYFREATRYRTFKTAPPKLREEKVKGKLLKRQHLMKQLQNME